MATEPPSSVMRALAAGRGRAEQADMATLKSVRGKSESGSITGAGAAAAAAAGGGGAAAAAAGAAGGAAAGAAAATYEGDLRSTKIMEKEKTK